MICQERRARIPPRKPKPLNPPTNQGGFRDAVKVGLAGLVLLAVAAGLAVYGMGTGADAAPRRPRRVMDAEAVARNRQMAVDMFYHSYDNYMRHAFRENGPCSLSFSPLTPQQAAHRLASLACGSRQHQ